MGRANLFTIPAGAPFLAVLADALLEDRLGLGVSPDDPLAFARATVVLPTRRACRALATVMLARSGGRATLLPRIRPIGVGDEDLDLLTDLAIEPHASPVHNALPPSVTEVERRLVLARFVGAWRSADGSETLPEISPAQSINLAADLARVMDLIETEEADVADLDAILEENLATHFQHTLAFLRIITGAWPNYLKASGRLAPAARRNAILDAESTRVASLAPNHAPLVVAGVSGSVPASARYIAAVAAAPNGYVVLPGLDQALDDDTWRMLAEGHPEHPQHGLARLLDCLGSDRAAFKELSSDVDRLTEGQRARNDLIGEAMRPAPKTPSWQAFSSALSSDDLRETLRGVHLIEAANTEEEADVIALALRGVAEDPAQSAALITPDRLLARRVAAKLETWGLKIDDSAGRPLAKTVPGALLDLVIRVIEENFSPVSVVSLLKHPLTRLSYPTGRIRQLTRLLELGTFRRIYLGQGIAGLKEQFARARFDSQSVTARPHASVRRMTDEDWDATEGLIADLEVAFAPLLECASSKDATSLGDWVAAHVETAETLTAPAVELERETTEVVDPDLVTEHASRSSGATSDTQAQATADEASDAAAQILRRDDHPLWAGEAGNTAASALSALLDPSLPHPELTAADYPDVYRALIAGQNVRQTATAHPRLNIWGPFEARLLQPDLVILGGLNEGVWPAPAEPDPWLNRPMRTALGLPAPEQALGFAAHDFTQALAAPRVVLTRALKRDGVPSVKSRWLLRLEAILRGAGQPDALSRMDPTPWLAWSRERTRIDTVTPISPPAPCPPVASRPRRLSVTQIETWMANPYAIFARHILRLSPVEPLGLMPDARVRGEIIHRALRGFSLRHPGPLPSDVAAALMDQAQQALEEFGAHTRVTAFWLPRLERFADWFAGEEPALRAGVTSIHPEINGQWVFDVDGKPFTLSGTADRIDALLDAGAAVYDYKTGTPPSAKEVASLLAPQLPLEAAMLASGAFPNLGARETNRLAYIHTKGGEPPGELIAMVEGTDACRQLAEAASRGLEALIRQYDREDMPYAALARPGFERQNRYDDYDHLARRSEWAVVNADDDAAGGSDG